MSEQQQDAPARGLRALTGEEFSAAEALGGVRGVVESVAPGLLFVVVYLVAGERLRPALIAAVAAAVLAVVVRLVQRTPVTQAFSGLLGVAVGVVWAWRSGAASNYFLVGLLTNGAYLVGTALTIVLGFPLVGLVVGLFAKDGPLSGGPWSAVLSWRGDRSRRRAYALATWPWVGMFAARLAVQLPLYLRSDVAWLGTAKLAMGLPLTALVLWVSWRMVRAAEGPPAAAPEHPAR